MIVILGLIIGAILGGTIAVRRKGKALDILQYAAVFAIIFAIVALFVTIILHRLAV